MNNEQTKNVIYVGNKNFSVYYSAIMRIFERGAKVVTVKSRGKPILNLIKIAEFIARTSNGARKLGEVKISSSIFKREGEAKPIFVPEISIPIQLTS